MRYMDKMSWQEWLKNECLSELELSSLLEAIQEDRDKRKVMSDVSGVTEAYYMVEEAEEEANRQADEVCQLEGVVEHLEGGLKHVRELFDKYLSCKETKERDEIGLDIISHLERL